MIQIKNYLFYEVDSAVKLYKVNSHLFTIHIQAKYSLLELKA